jgi:hypothetical protein
VKKFALCAAMLAALVLPVSAAAVTPGKPSTVLRYYYVSSGFKASVPMDQEPKLGDHIWFKGSIHKWNGAKKGARVGFAEVDGVILSRSTMRLSVQAHLPGGTLVMAGDLVGESRHSKLAVVGGTGKLAGSHGEIDIRDIGGDESEASALVIRLWK